MSGRVAVLAAALTVASAAGRAGGVTPQISGGLPPSRMPILLAVIVIALAALGGGGAAAYRTRLSGSLEFTRDGEVRRLVRLPPLPMLLRRTRPLIATGGILLVHRLPGDRMLVRLWFTDGRTLAQAFVPGEARSLLGVDIAHVRRRAVAPPAGGR